jgi:hypothetical protein
MLPNHQIYAQPESTIYSLRILAEIRWILSSFDNFFQESEIEKSGFERTMLRVGGTLHPRCAILHG